MPQKAPPLDSKTTGGGRVSLHGDRRWSALSPNSCHLVRSQNSLTEKPKKGRSPRLIEFSQQNSGHCREFDDHSLQLDHLESALHLSPTPKKDRNMPDEGLFKAFRL